MNPTKVNPNSIEHYVTAFAKALSPETNQVLLIDADNIHRAFVPWTPDLSRCVFAVRLAHEGMFHTLALDFDAKEVGHDMADTEARYVKDLLTRTNIRSVLVASGPGGGRHLLATIGGSGLSPGTMRKLVERLRGLGLQSLDISCATNPTTGSIRVPLSVHRHGGRSRVLEMSDADALGLLQRTQNPALFKDLAAALPAVTVRSQLLATGRSIEAPRGDRIFTTGSEEVQSIATRFVNRGCAYAAFAEHIRAGDGMSGGALASVEKHRRGGDLARWLELSWRNAEIFVVENPKVGASWTRCDAEVLDSWEGQITRARLANDAARRMAEALLQEAHQQGRALVGMSVRQGAEATNGSRSTMHRALVRLTDAGMIELAGRADRSATGHRYRLQHSSLWLGAAAGTPDMPPAPGGVRKQTVPVAAALAADLTADIWGRKALGESARLVYLALSTDLSNGHEVHVSDVSTKSSLAFRTVHTHLAALRSVGLVRQLGGGHWVAEHRDPVDVALDLGMIPGAVEERRRIHIRERRDDKVRMTLERLRRLHKRAGGTPAPFLPRRTENRSQITEISIPTDITVNIDVLEEQPA